MNPREEIVIDSDDNAGNISVEEDFAEEQYEVKLEPLDFPIEAMNKEIIYDPEEGVSYDGNVPPYVNAINSEGKRHKNRHDDKSRLIEEMMLEEMDIQNEQYVLKKVKHLNKPDNGQTTPTDIMDTNKPINLTQKESDITQSDIPERLQNLYGTRPKKISQEELEIEAKWISRRLERKKKLSLDSDPDVLVNQVMHVLDLIKNQYFEVMYIHTYKFNEMVDLTLTDLWFIQNKDTEWRQMSEKKLKLQKLNEDKIAHEPTQIYIDNLILNSFDEYTLESISDYIKFKELLLNPTGSTLTIPIIAGININEVYSNESLKETLLECVSEIFLTPEDFAFNLKHNNLIRSPKQISQKPAHYFSIKKELLEVENTNSTYNIMNFFQTITFLMAHELYYHPLVRAFARRIYLEKVKVSTRPKAQDSLQAEASQSKIDIYKPDYCVKRIKNRPFTQFKADETGIYLMKNSSEAKIDLCFHTSDEIVNIFDLNALSPEKDGMLKYLVSHFTSQENNDEFAAEWNLIRKECINFLVHHLMYPHLQRELEKDIIETSEKAVINYCAEKLKYIICNGPCLTPQDDRSYAKVMAIVLTEDQKILAVSIDRNGMLTNASEKLDFAPFKMMNSQQTIENVESSKKEEYQVLTNFVYKNEPELIVIGDHTISRRVIRKIVRDCEDYPLSEELTRNIIYCSSEIPKLLLEAPSTWAWNQMEYTELDNDQRVAISLGRMQQDGLVEVAKLWNENVDENQLLKVHLHELQAFINRQKLMDRYREVLVEISNKTGIDLNQILEQRHRAAPFQFICGLGPIKAHYFLTLAAEKETSSIKQRNYIFRFEKDCFQDKVFWNAVGFIKVEPLNTEVSIEDYKPQDQTRIHPSWYGLAKKIEKDTFEGVAEESTDVLEKARCHPELLKEVDIEDFAVHLEQSKGMKNMKPVLEFIISELISPFKRYRRPFAEWSQEFLFYKMTCLSQFHYQVGSIIEGTVIKTAPTVLTIQIEGGLESIIYKYEIFDKDSSVDLSKEFYEGQPIVARIVNLNYQNFKTDFSSLVKIGLTLKPTLLNSHKDYILAIHSNLDEYNMIDANNDYPVLISNKRKKTNYKDRMIMHNRFKNVSAEEAIDLLQDKNVGEFLFRPCKRRDRIFITWKFYEHIYTNIEIQEGERPSGEPISKTLTINKKCFSSLNEIIAHYITPCNKFVKTIMQHPKFIRGDLAVATQQLEMEKEAEPKFIPYHLIFSKDAPQYVLLCYLKNASLVSEYIKIDGSGYYFHDALFIVFEELIRYFKANQNKPDYVNFVQTGKKPFVEVVVDEDDEDIPSRPINSGFGIESIKWRDRQKVTFEDIDRIPDQDSIIIKQEKKPPGICENCGVRGHQANQCPVLPSRPRNRNFGDRREGWKNRDVQNDPQEGWSQPVDDSWGPSAGDSWGQSESKDKGGNEASGWGSETKNTQVSWGASEPKQSASSSWGEGGQASWGASGGDNAWGSTGDSKKWGDDNNTSWGNDRKSSWQGRDSGKDTDDGKPKKKGCFNCGEEGHMSRECPNPSTKPKGKGCFNCGEEGHMSRECPNPSTKPKSKGCFKCGEEGHMSRECPNPNTQSRPSNKGACFKCGEEGHMSRECPNPSTQSRPNNRACFKCGEEGHMSRECPNPNSNNGSFKPRRREDNDRSRERNEETASDSHRGGWNKSGNSGWGTSQSEGHENGWGSKGGDSWGAKTNDSWGAKGDNNASSSGTNGGWGSSNNTTNDTWGSKGDNNATSTNADAGWGSGINNATNSWGTPEKSSSETKNDSWGSTNQTAVATSTWGASSSEFTAPKSKAGSSIYDTWGASTQQGTNSFATNDSWGAPAQQETKVASANSTWGNSTQPETKASIANDSWGSSVQQETKVSATNDSWGATTQHENKSAVTKDSWGAPAQQETKVAPANSTWGNSTQPETESPIVNDSWGSSVQQETKAAATTDSWGATTQQSQPATTNNSWGTPAQQEVKPTTTDNSWVAPSSSAWGESKKVEAQPVSSGDSWGESKKTEIKSTANSSSWGQPSGDSWGESKKDESKPTANNSSWGASSNSSWGEPNKQEVKPAVINDSWGASSSNSWGDSSKQEMKSSSNNAWETSGGDSWGQNQQETKTGGNNSWGSNTSNNDNKEGSKASAWGASSNNDWGSGSSSWGGNGSGDNSSNRKGSGSGAWGQSGNSWGKSGDNSDSKPFGGRGSDRNESRGPRSCFNCGGEGHMSRECPNPSTKPKSKGCFKCGEEGHMSRECPNPNTQSRPSNKGACFKCGEEGHMSRECPNPSTQSRPNNRACFKCGEEGHMSRECPNPNTQSRPSNKGACFKCGEEGHMSRECPNPGKPRRRDDDKSQDRNQERGDNRQPRGGSSWKKDSDDGDFGRRRRDNNSGGSDRKSSNNSWGNSGASGGWGKSNDDNSAQKSDGWGKTSDSWGAGDNTKSHGGWNSSKADDSWGQNKSNDTWGAGSGAKSAEAKNDTWGSAQKAPENKNDTWGSASKNPSSENKNDTWGSAQKTPENKNDSWGQSKKNDTWGSGSGAKPSETKNDTWGSESGAKSAEAKKDTWESAQKTPENKNDSWGQSKKNDTWGTGSGAKSSEAKNDTWGSAQKSPEKKNDSWGSSNKNQSTETQKQGGNSDEEGQIGTWDNQKLSKPKKNENEWGTHAKSDSWGDKPKEENNSSWGAGGGGKW